LKDKSRVTAFTPHNNHPVITRKGPALANPGKSGFMASALLHMVKREGKHMMGKFNLGSSDCSTSHVIPARGQSMFVLPA
jgi:hypothetical protein